MKHLLTILLASVISTQAAAIDQSRPYYPPRDPYNAGRCGWYYGTPDCPGSGPERPLREWRMPDWRHPFGQPKPRPLPPRDPRYDRPGGW